MKRLPSYLAGSTIIEHDSRESFMRATGRCPHGVIEAPPLAEGISAAEARAGLRAAYAEPQLATDAEIRACSRLAATAGGGQ